MIKKGTLMIVSGPAGVGKGTIVKEAINRAGGQIKLSISATTRNPRPTDEDGVTYFFKTKEEFKKLIDNDKMLEWAIYSDNFYGTPKIPVYDALDNGYDVILEIEVQGAMQIRAHHPEAVFVFIMPPSIEELERRLTDRNTETKEEIERRMATAKHEIGYLPKYNYIIVNEEVETAVEDMLAIFRADKLTKERYLN